ncbi:hypothetical protein [Longimycelium tulufanense]|nr:hypothetical protein [Longimycelium tulufanense]
MISVSLRENVDPRRVGQSIADAVGGAARPMVARVARVPVTVEEQAKVWRFAWRTGQVPPEQSAVYLMACHVQPDTEGEVPGTEELGLMVHHPGTDYLPVASQLVVDVEVDAPRLERGRFRHRPRVLRLTRPPV